VAKKYGPQFRGDIYELKRRGVKEKLGGFLWRFSIFDKQIVVLISERWQKVGNAIYFLRV